MLNSILNETVSANAVDIKGFFICVGVSLILGLFIALLHNCKTTSSKSFATTLALLPSIVCIVIMMVNGSIGTGIAVAGAFSLVRFRSQPGTAKEICSIFLAMAAGLITGMGYIFCAVVFVAIMAAVMLVYNAVGFGNEELDLSEKTLKILIPESLDYSNAFTDIFEKYTLGYPLVAVKTTNMGSMFRLTYNVKLKDIEEEKNFIDDLRCRNGNLEIMMLKKEVREHEL